jgi:capsular polysaccharide biosynthesis protein
MDFWSSMKVIGRQWKVFVPALVVSVIIVGGVITTVKPSYVAKAQLLLVPPQVSTQSVSSTPLSSGGRQTNPYLGFGNLNIVAAIVSAQETNSRASSRLQGAGVSDSYTVAPDPLGQIPELNIEVTGSDPAAALAQAATIVRDAETQLATNQRIAGAPNGTEITTLLLASPASTVQNKSRLRVGAAVLAVCLATSIAVAFAAESVSRRRRESLDDVAAGPPQGTSVSGASVGNGSSSPHVIPWPEGSEDATPPSPTRPPNLASN